MEACGFCRRFVPDAPNEGAGPARTMPGFGRCREQGNDESRSAWPWGCAFTPSRYEPADYNSPPKEHTDQPRAPSAADRPPLELT